MRKGLFLSCFALLASYLQAEKIVQCVTNFPIDAEMYTHALKERGYDGRVVVVNIKDYDNDLLMRKGRFHEILRALHLDYPWKAQVSDDVDKIVFFNVNPNVVKKYDLSRFPKEKMVLFMWEPFTVLPTMYLPKVQNCFSKIYTWDDALVDGRTYFKFYYPVFVPRLESIPSFEEKKLCTLVCSNLKSSNRAELYSQRIEAIRYFERVGEEGFEFYGRKWDPAQYKSYKGQIEDKLGTIKNYRFAICYENTADVCGYVTEKIFDCFAAGVVPVYWGASNIGDFVPGDCFVDRRDFASMEELHQFMRSMSKETYEGYLVHIRAFLQSDGVKKFTFDHLADAFYQAVSQGSL